MKLTDSQFLNLIQHAPLVSIDLVIKDFENRILLGQRKNEPARDYWFVPGGRIYKNETIEQAFHRISTAELATELSLADSLFLGVYTHIYDTNFFNKPDISTHYVSLAYEARFESGFSPDIWEQHRQYRWFTREMAEKGVVDGRDRGVHPYSKVFFE